MGNHSYRWESSRKVNPLWLVDYVSHQSGVRDTYPQGICALAIAERKSLKEEPRNGRDLTDNPKFIYRLRSFEHTFFTFVSDILSYCYFSRCHQLVSECLLWVPSHGESATAGLEQPGITISAPFLRGHWKANLRQSTCAIDYCFNFPIHRQWEHNEQDNFSFHRSRMLLDLFVTNVQQRHYSYYECLICHRAIAAS